MYSDILNNGSPNPTRWGFYSDGKFDVHSNHENLRGSGNYIFMERVSLSYILVRGIGLVFFLHLESSPFMPFFGLLWKERIHHTFEGVKSRLSS